MSTHYRALKANSSRVLFAAALLSCVVVCLEGCVGNQPYPSDPNKGQAEMKLEQPGQGGASGKQAMLAALSYFEMVDDEAAQWRANFKLANERIQQNDVQTALEFAGHAHQLAEKLQEKHYLFRSSIQMGQLSGKPFYYDQAAEYASTDIEQAIALTCLHQYSQAKALFEGYDEHEHPDEFAFLYYHYGKNSADVSAVITALELYRQAGNVYGVVDSLYLAARLSEPSELARQYGERALRAARHLPDHQRRSVIERWLATLPD